MDNVRAYILKGKFLLCLTHYLSYIWVVEVKNFTPTDYLFLLAQQISSPTTYFVGPTNLTTYFSFVSLSSSTRTESPDAALAFTFPSPASAPAVLTIGG